MRFALSHKVATYLMVACAYLAVASSGELSPVLMLLALAGIGASWRWGEARTKAGRATHVWTGVAVAFFAYSAIAFLAGADIILVGAEFLVMLLVVKLFNRHAPKDYLHVYILSFLMLVSGTVLNAELSYGVFFLGYVISSTWALILFHLRREIEESFFLSTADHAEGRARARRLLASRKVVGPRFFVATSLVSLTVFFAAILLFLAIPRIGFGLFFSKDRGGLHMAGFSDGVELGGHGVIKNDSTVVMRVKVDDAYQGRAAPYVHWRGVAFDHYSDGEWRRSKKAPETRSQVSMVGGETLYHLLYDGDRQSNAELERRQSAAVRQEIYLEPLGYDVLFGASMPLSFSFETQWKNRAKTGRNDEIRHRHSAGIRYVVHSRLASPSPAELRQATGELPDGYDAYLQLPPEISDRVRELAAEITRDATTAYDRALALETWLSTELDYTLQMESPGDSEPIDFFLFERKAGHCEYFSSAMSVMARSLGLPARNVNGFLGGEWNEYDDYIAVRAGDAHSWAEIYFPGAGWVTFDPTPSAEIDRLGRGDQGFGARLRRLADTMRFKWFKWVVEYDLHRQMRLLKKIGSFFRGGASSMFRERSKAARSFARSHKRSAAIAVVAVASLLVVVALLRRRRREDAALLPQGPRRRRRSAVTAHYLAAVRRLRRRGHRRAPQVTPREYARALLDAGAPGARDLGELTELYYAVTYGDARDDELSPRARELRDRIQRAPKTPRP